MGALKLPSLHLGSNPDQHYVSEFLNRPIRSLKHGLNSGSAANPCRNFGYYLGYRFLSVIMLPINAIGCALTLAIGILTSPLALFQSSRGLPKYFLSNAFEFSFCLLMDSTYEFRAAGRVFCQILNKMGANIPIGPYFYAI